MTRFEEIDNSQEVFIDELFVGFGH